MNPYQAYQSQKNPSMPRVELALALYRKALENLETARAAFAERRPAAARSSLLRTQLIVASLSADLPAYQDENAVNFLRLYEFVAHQIALETLDGVDAATRVLLPLLEAFEAVREQALSLEKQGVIPSLDNVRQVSVSA